jgi:hypothetical protein
MGPVVTWIVAGTEGAAVQVAAGTRAAELTGVVIPYDSVVKYELDVKAGKFLVLSPGGVEAIAPAQAMVGTTRPSFLEINSLGRKAVLGLLSDDEVASVSTAEAAAGLADGEEYIDLQALDQGVRRARNAAVTMGQVLPRRAVHEGTWNKILIQLTMGVGAPSGAAPPTTRAPAPLDAGEPA